MDLGLSQLQYVVLRMVGSEFSLSKQNKPSSTLLVGRGVGVGDSSWAPLVVGDGPQSLPHASGV